MPPLTTKLPKYLKYDDKEDIYYYQSHSKPNKWYEVIPWIRERNRWSCDCPDFYFNYSCKPMRDIHISYQCKHIKQLLFIDKARLAGLVDIT